MSPARGAADASGYVGLNMDRTQRVAEDLAQIDWVPSPSGAVHRRMLERERAETGVATSVVRYPEGSAFAPHTHGGGEEFFVLSGVFEDEHGAYPAGSYVRNPIGTAHQPFSTNGCQLFVKLWQMTDAQDTPVVLRPEAIAWNADGAGRRAVLYRDDRETVELVDAPSGELGGPDSDFELLLANTEILLYEGSLVVDGARWHAPAWLRTPAGGGGLATLIAGGRAWLKRGHLGR